MSPLRRIAAVGPGWALGLLLGLLPTSAAAAQTVVRPDTARPAVTDTSRKAQPDTGRRAQGASTPAPAAPAPADSTLAAACAGGGGLAADLLVVLFAATAADSDRVALAKAVGGALAGPADAIRAGGYYLRIPNADLDPTVADRVIRYATVQEVGPVSCPAK